MIYFELNFVKGGGGVDVSFHPSLPPYAAAATKSLQSCPTLCDPIDPTRLPRPWDSPGKNTGVGCHFLLQLMKVKSDSEVAQSCPTLSDPMDWSLPGSSVHGIFQARVLEWGAIAFSVPPYMTIQLFEDCWKDSVKDFKPTNKQWSFSRDSLRAFTFTAVLFSCSSEIIKMSKSPTCEP